MRSSAKTDHATFSTHCTKPAQATRPPAQRRFHRRRPRAVRRPPAAQARRRRAHARDGHPWPILSAPPSAARARAGGVRAPTAGRDAERRPMAGARAPRLHPPPRARFPLHRRPLAARPPCLLDRARRPARNRASEGAFRGGASRPLRYAQCRRRKGWWTPRTRRGCLVGRFAARVPCVVGRAMCQKHGGSTGAGSCPARHMHAQYGSVEKGSSVAIQRPRRAFHNRVACSSALSARSGDIQHAAANKPCRGCSRRRSSGAGGEQAAVSRLGFIRGRGTRGGGSGRKRRGGM